MKFNIHWVIYPVLVIILGCALWFWHTESLKEALASQAVTAVQKTQATVDKQATADDKTAQKNLESQNAALQKALADAKTQAQQIALINKDAGVHLSVQPTPQPSGSKPSTDAPVPPVVVLPTSDVPELAEQTVDFKEAENQVVADKLVIADDQEQISARDKTIAAQASDIKTLKGGSKFVRFMKAARNVAIGGAIGYVVARETK